MHVCVLGAPLASVGAHETPLVEQHKACIGTPPGCMTGTQYKDRCERRRLTVKRLMQGSCQSVLNFSRDVIDGSLDLQLLITLGIQVMNTLYNLWHPIQYLMTCCDSLYRILVVKRITVGNALQQHSYSSLYISTGLRGSPGPLPLIANRYDAGLARVVSARRF